MPQLEKSLHTATKTQYSQNNNNNNNNMYIYISGEKIQEYGNRKEKEIGGKGQHGRDGVKPIYQAPAYSSGCR